MTATQPKSTAGPFKEVATGGFEALFLQCFEDKVGRRCPENSENASTVTKPVRRMRYLPAIKK